MAKRKRFADKEQKKAIYKRAKGRCEACKIPLKKTSGEYHHIKAYVDGGETTIENLALVCDMCHQHAPYDSEDWDNYVRSGGTLLPFLIGQALVTTYNWYKEYGGKPLKEYKKEKMNMYKTLDPFFKKRIIEI